MINFHDERIESDLINSPFLLVPAIRFVLKKPFELDMQINEISSIKLN